MDKGTLHSFIVELLSESAQGSMEALLSVFSHIKKYLNVHGNLILLHGEVGLALNHSANPFFEKCKEKGFKINRFGPLHYAYVQENPVYISAIQDTRELKPSGFDGYLGSSLIVYPVKAFSLCSDHDVLATFHSPDKNTISEWDFYVVSLVMEHILPQMLLKSEIFRFLKSQSTVESIILLQHKEEALHDLKNAICPFYFLKDLTEENSISKTAVDRLIVRSHQFFNQKNIADAVHNEEPKEIEMKGLFLELQKIFSGFPNLNLRFKLPSSQIKIKVRPMQFEALFVNLIKNAWEACKQISKDATVTLQCRRVKSSVSNPYIFIHLSENGPGFDPLVLKKIMLGQCVTTKTSGSGIGLRSIKRILKGHNASFRLYSVPDKGSRVLIRLPQAI